MINIWIHSNIARLAHGKMNWSFEPKNLETPVSEVLQNAFASEKNLYFGIIDETGKLRKHINIYKGNIDIKSLDGLKSIINDNDEINIFTAVSGG
jgi:sulfur-carrier protein